MDDEGGASLSPSRSGSPHRIVDPVAVAAASPGHLALGKGDPFSSGGSGGDMEDPWSDCATSTLIEAWGRRFFALGRGALTHPDWQDVADVVSSREDYSKARKTPMQCKDYMEMLKMQHKTGNAASDSFLELLDPILKLEGAAGKWSFCNPTKPMCTRVNFRQPTRTAPIAEEDPSSADGSGGDREDAWSEGATYKLIKAWGERLVTHSDGSGSLGHSHWQEIADVVSSRENYSKQIKSSKECKNYVDILKKKYKAGKLKSDPSFHLLEASLKLGGTANSGKSGSSNLRTQSDVPVCPPISFPRRTRSGKRQRLEESANRTASSDRLQGLRDLAHAIRQLGEVYERVEFSRREHEFKMQRYRLNAARQLEEQRVQFFIKMHTEISKANNNGGADATGIGNGVDSDRTRSGRAKRKRDSSP